MKLSWIPVLLVFAQVASAAELPHYKAGEGVSGEIRLWGSPDDAALVSAWDEGFRKFHPQARIAARFHGPESTLASLYTGVADVAFVARELRLPVDTMAFQWTKLYAPMTVEVANAGVHGARLAANLAVFVNSANPIAGLTVAQLDGVFGAEHKRGGANLRHWGDLGLEGEWRDREIHVLAPKVNSIAALFFRRAILDNSFKWNESLREYDDEAAALAEVARDPSAIVYARAGSAVAGAKMLPIAAAPGAPFIALDEKTAADRSYPLSRVVIVAVDRPPGKPLDPRVREFLRFVLSAEGQAGIARDGAYVPLAEHDARVQRKRLD